MSVEQVKKEIDQILSSLPPENLVDILEYLRSAQQAQAEQINLSSNFRKILQEDANLLKRLAE